MNDIIPITSGQDYAELLAKKEAQEKPIDAGNGRVYCKIHPTCSYYPDRFHSCFRCYMKKMREGEQRV